MRRSLAILLAALSLLQTPAFAAQPDLFFLASPRLLASLRLEPSGEAATYNGNKTINGLFTVQNGAGDDGDIIAAFKNAAGTARFDFADKDTGISGNLGSFHIGSEGGIQNNNSIINFFGNTGTSIQFTPGASQKLIFKGTFNSGTMLFTDDVGGDNYSFSLSGTNTAGISALNSTGFFIRAAGAAKRVDLATSNGDNVAGILQDGTANTEGEFQVLKKSVVHGNAGSGAGEALTVTSNAISPTTGYARVTCSAGTLKTINNAVNGAELWLDFVDTCTIDETANIIVTGATLAMTADDVVLFRYNGTKWKQLTAVVLH